MNDDKLELTISNRLMIGLTILLSIMLICSVAYLIISLNDKPESIPNLYVEKGKTSTIVATTTKIETTTTSSTTQKRELKSPYYDIDVNELFSDPLYTKEKVNKEEAEKILMDFYNYMNSLFNTNDNSVFDIKTTIEYAKNNEKDAIKVDDKKYGIIYHGNEIIEKLLTKGNSYNLYKMTYDSKHIFQMKDNEIYRIEPLNNNNKLEFVSITLDNYNNSTINGFVKYYDANYIEQGYTAPQYKNVKLQLRYKDGRWRVDSYKYPIYEVE